MKYLITIALFSAIFCGFLNEQGDLYEYLKKNAPYEVYAPEENPFKDYTIEEIKAMLTDAQYPEIKLEAETEVTGDVPEEYDFRVLYPECKQEIRNQLSCGSCWAFAGTSSLAERFCVATKGAINVVLSAQDSVSCDTGNNGCNGGNRLRTWQYFQNTGVVTETCLPYTSGSGIVEDCPSKCKNEEEWVKYKAKNIKVLNSPAQIKEEVYNNGPVHTGFSVYQDFMNYKSGIYTHVSGGLLGGHAVVIVGWGVEAETQTKYWIVQNSWGANWGEEGYFRIKEGECSFDVYAATGLPVVE